MKQILLILTLFFSVAATAQDVDSTKIDQTVTIPQVYAEYIYDHMSDRTSADAINFINALVWQMDTVKRSNKPITFVMPSGFILARFSDLSHVPEGQAAQYNENLLAIFSGQITNPWLGNQVYGVRNLNWQIRDAGIDNAHDFLRKIKKPQ